MKIHPTAIVEDGARLGADVEVGPRAYIGKDAVIGDGTVIRQGAIIDGHTTIGSCCQVFPYACIGMKTQDLKYQEGSVSYVEIGDRTVIREFATIHLGTADGEKTILGKDCLFMCYCHAAHGVILGDHVICSNAVQLAGDVHLEDYAIVGGVSAVHQFCTVGRHAMIGGCSRVVKDMPPYMLGGASDEGFRVVGPNAVGLARRGFSKEAVAALEKASRLLYHKKLNRTQALAAIESEVEKTEEVRYLLDFFHRSQRGAY